ncbi:hypothetical protein COHA_001801 [Chlorella ohadii]|uniref:Uncharacterized protein n=1 Tax=Chlorella ohadii TaxID=2649997 RepID=A0AAD5H842_9CHLO|nr:hypothetical protein COHA_001801 [Chlorella ohadii]
MLALQTSRIAAPAKVQVTRRQQVVVCATAQQQEAAEAVPRRAAIGLLAAAVLGLSADAAQAVGVAKNGSRAGSEGYGTKKQGISPKRKRAVLDKVRKAAGKQ